MSFPSVILSRARGKRRTIARNMECPDDVLIAKTLDGDISCFNQLIKRYQRSVYNIAYKTLGNAEDAQDVTQEAFIKAFRSLDTYRKGAVFAAWIYRITSNLCIDYFRARKPTVSLDTAVNPERSSMQDSANNPETLVLRKSHAEYIREAIMDLPENYRNVIILRHFQGMSVEEISQLLDIPQGTVKTHLYRGRERLRLRLAPLIG